MLETGMNNADCMMDVRMKIAIDAMGGDKAPEAIVRGAAQGARLHEVDIVLVGDEAAVRKYLSPADIASGRISIRHSSEVIGMNEHAAAVRTKKDASIVVAASLVREGMADAMVSLGNTAAAMAIATLRLGRIPGIDRPAIATVWPAKNGPTVLLDSGAVSDCNVKNMIEFAIMGSIYAEKVLGIASPRVALLSIGEEAIKGNELTKATHEALNHTPLNFAGNVEGRDLLSSVADVIVADGFVGNVALKVAEGLLEHFMYLVKDDLRNHPLSLLPVFMLKPFLNRIQKKLDYSEHGGAPLLGLNGICIIGHGRSNAHAVVNAVKAAKHAVSAELVHSIASSVAVIRSQMQPVAEKVTSGA